MAWQVNFDDNPNILIVYKLVSVYYIVSTIHK